MLPSTSEFAFPDPEPPPRRRALAIAIVILFAVMIGAATTLALLISSDGGSRTRSASDATSTTAPSTTTRPPTTTTTTPPPIRYEVREGESLSGIAQRFGVSVLRLAAVNKILDPNRITPHQMLRIPRIALVVDPVTVTGGGSVSIRLTGAGPGEAITFTIDSPAGSYRGTPHIASPTGIVTASYGTAVIDPPGPRTVTATGSQGSRVQATFTVEAPPAG
jgi:LysM repeat protein